MPPAVVERSEVTLQRSAAASSGLAPENFQAGVAGSSLADYRAWFERTKDGWRLMGFLAGD